MTTLPPAPTESASANLSGVPETALLTLYHRAAIAERSPDILTDPEGVRVLKSIDYPFRRRFGPPRVAFAVRSRVFDDQVVAFLQASPAGQVVALGDGLETQRFRVDNGRCVRLSVDLPDAIAFRERFIRPDARHRHIAGSALDPGWLDGVDATAPCFIVAQGLLMYLREREVRGLFERLAERLPGAWMLFDTVPDWLRRWTGLGLPAGPRYVAPPMGWSLPESRQAVLREWVPALKVLRNVDYGHPDRRIGAALATLRRFDGVRSRMPAVVLLRF